MKALASLFSLVTCAALVSAAEFNTLTPAEQKDGWKLLFDGKSLAGWRTYKEGGKIGAGWVVEDGLLKKQAKISGGDIMTEQPIPATADWELFWEWRIAEKGNNGVKYSSLKRARARSATSISCSTTTATLTARSAPIARPAPFTT